MRTCVVVVFSLSHLAKLNCIAPVCTERKRVIGVGVQRSQVMLVVVGMGREGMIRLLPPGRFWIPRAIVIVSQPDQTSLALRSPLWRGDFL